MIAPPAGEAFDVFEFNHREFMKGEWLARVIQYPNGRLRVTGRSYMAADIRSRAGTEFGTSAGLLLTGMSLYLIEDARALEFSESRPAPTPTLLGVDDLLLAAAGVAASRAAGRAQPAVPAELRYRLLGEALGVDDDLFDPAGQLSNRSHAWNVVKEMVQSLTGISDPFAGLLEAPAEVAALYRAHSGPIREAAELFREALLAAGRDAMETACPGVNLRAAIEQDLYDAGLPRPETTRDGFDDERSDTPGAGR